MVSQIINLTIVYPTVYSAQIKVSIKAPRHWLLWGYSPVTGEFPAQRASNAEKVSIWWRHHAYDWRNAKKVNLEDMGKTVQFPTKPHAHISVDLSYI